MLKLYKNKNQEFSCKIKIEGADKSTAKPRLVLYPDNDSRNIFFEGKIEDGICKINVLPNLSITETGKAVLEVIVENSIIFQPWNTEYEIITEKVKVEEVHVSNSHMGATIKVLEDDVKIDDKKLISAKKVAQAVVKPKVQEKAKIQENKPKPIVKKKKTFDDLLEEAANMIKEPSIDEDKKLLKIYNESIASLDKKDLIKMVNFVKKEFVPTEKSIKWAKKVLGETKSTRSKLLMYANEIKNGIK